MRLIVALMIFMTACANTNDSKPTGVGLSIASIPEGCAKMDIMGAHEFIRNSGDILFTDTYDCGLREGKICHYYVHNPDLMDTAFKYDTRCY